MDNGLTFKSPGCAQTMNTYRAKTTRPGGRLISRRAFVVQLHEARPAQPSEGVSGRVENIATGENAEFDSLQELDEFMRQSRDKAD